MTSYKNPLILLLAFVLPSQIFAHTIYRQDYCEVYPDINVTGVFDRALVRPTTNTWPNKTVIYKLTDSVDIGFLEALFWVFAELASGTCIRALPQKPGDDTAVSMIKDSAWGALSGGTLGYAHVGYIKGYPLEMHLTWPSRDTVTHELGHVLGLSHEHSSSDRHAELRYPVWCPSTSKIEEDRKHLHYYDIGSVTHYGCGFCMRSKEYKNRGCGSDITLAFSNIDLDSLNQFYDCRSCKSHRWISDKELSGVFTTLLGADGAKSTNLLACRAYYRSGVYSGMLFGDGKNFYCEAPAVNRSISWNTKLSPMKFTSRFEVIHFEAGYNSTKFSYQLHEINQDNLEHENMARIFHFAVTSGRDLNGDSKSSGVQYIAVATVDESKCGGSSHSTKVGRVTRYGDKLQSYFGVCGKVESPRIFKILVCMENTLQETPGVEYFFPTENTPWFKSINGKLGAGTLVDMNGYVPWNCKRFSIALSKDRGTDNFLFHIEFRLDEFQIRLLTKQAGLTTSAVLVDSWFDIDYNKYFNLVIECFEDGFGVALNQQFFTVLRKTEYMSRARFVAIRGNVHVLDVKFHNLK